MIEMKKMLLPLMALFFAAQSAIAQPFGYKVTVNFSEPIPDKQVFLAHYFGKGLPTIYKTDSAKVINGTTAVFSNKDSILGGIYIVMYKENTNYFQLMLDNGYDVTATVGKDSRAHFSSNKINQDFEKHETFMVAQMAKKNKLMEAYKIAKTKSDSTKIEKQFEALTKEEKSYRRNYVKTTPKNLLTQVFNAMDAPDIPEGKHYLADGKTVDSMFAFNYYKSHFWDKFDFTDNRLAKTPLLDGRLNEYFSRLVLPIPDTLNWEMDNLLKKAEPAKEVYKYILHWLGNFTAESRTMGVDASFVHLVENYFGKGKAYWLDEKAVARYQDRAKKIAPNLLGSVAPELDLVNLFTLQPELIHNVKAPYTVIFIWDKECGNCMQELPEILKLYNSDLKKRGVKIFSIPTSGDAVVLREFVKEKGLEDWIHAVDANNSKKYQEMYDAYSTPQVYVLDKDKIIIGKKISHENILKVIEFDENRKKNANKK